MSDEHYLDARRLLCPMPVIKLQNFIEDLPAGSRVHVQCSDPGAINDIPAWCRINGHTVLDIDQNGDDIRIRVEKGDD